MKLRVLWSLAVLSVLVCGPVAPASAQATQAATRLEIRGTGTTPMSLGAADLKAMPRTTLRVGGQNGQPAQVYEGVALGELLRRAGTPQGGDVGGPWMAAYVIAVASDGYRAAFSLAELTAGLGVTEVLVADTLDGAALGNGAGPFRLIVPNDKRAARWVRNLTSIRVEQPPN